MLRRQVQKPRLRPVWGLVTTMLVSLTVPPAAAAFGVGIMLAVNASIPVEPEPPTLNLKVSEVLDPYYPSTSTEPSLITFEGDLYRPTDTFSIAGRLDLNGMDVGAEIKNLKKKCK